ncbi:MAG: ester cyclase [Candidatus Hydrogenedentes bacterium]|nr:ester cyclase [Candidatus Hydrogenedentota bacterium]
MKTLRVGIVLILVLAGASCTIRPHEPWINRSAAAQGRLATVRAYYDALNRRDLDALLGCFVERGSYTDPTLEEPLTGDEIADYALSMYSAFPDVEFEVVHYGESGDGRAVAQWIMRGTHTGTTEAGAAPTGEKFEVSGMAFFALEGVKIASVEVFYDQLAYLTQLGLVAASPAAS